MTQHDMDIANADGASVRADLNVAFQAIAENNSGATAPSTTFSYQLWADTANDLMKIRNAANSAWIVAFRLSTAGMVQGADIASAAALPVLVDGVFNDVTGTTTITSIDALGIGTLKFLQFDGALTITHNATDLILPGGKNIITVAGDVLGFYEYAAGDWRLISNSADALPYRKGADVASGTALPVLDSGAFDVTGTTTITSIDSVGVGAIILLQFDGIVTVTHDATNLILPNGENITTVAGQILVFHEYAAGDWRLVSDSEPVGSEITLGTEQASTSGTAIDFTSIPAGTKKITIMLVGVSTDGTEELLIQLGDSGGVETSGYFSGVGNISSNIGSTAGFILEVAGVATNIIEGNIVLTLENSANFTWTASINTLRSNSTDNYAGAGSKSLSAELDRVRITTTGTPDDFDLGVINIQYQ